MNKTKTYLENILLLFIYTLALFPILSRGVESVLMIAIFVLSVFYYFKFNIKKATKKQLSQVFTFSLLFFIYLFSLAYSSDLKTGVNYLVKVIPIVMFPIIFGVLIPNLLTMEKIKRTFNLYVLAIFFGLIFIHTYLFFTLNENILIDNWEYRNAFEALTDVHGTYFSIWIGFGLFIVFFRIISAIKCKNHTLLTFWLAVGIYLMYWQLKLGARVPQLFTIILIVVLFFTKVKNKKYRLIGVLGLSIFTVGIFIFKPNFVDRLKDLANYDFSLPQGDYNYDFETITNEQIRNGIYFCSFKLIKKSWLTGYGIGDVDEQLQKCYNNELDSNVYTMFNYNSHNQYLHLLLTAGVLGLLLFLISFTLSIYISFKDANLLYILFSFFILFSLFTENVLSRHDGILFYSFFNAIFAFSNKGSLK
ncbi:O-antigen ligase family protein [Aureibaculum sp. 2210JD6-5]|uniref:O-antigen ligase family protein n=1 Tax=Aureibaculum sp. 2210JD6-5 TaxID=3103957 RepID=UPI002AAD3079|nr:O-antigen ligase family protein [Aureibaculum sp. 2210JD6-5]MDY7396188.1 O-antigen ligase family protein [Aureibaculum sp. 2210JD6-5]